MDSPRHFPRQARAHDERIFKFPGVASTAQAATLLRPVATVEAPSDEADAPAHTDVLCDLSAYRGLSRGIDHHLRRLDAGLKQLAGELDSYRFPLPGDDEPRSAA